MHIERINSLSLYFIFLRLLLAYITQNLNVKVPQVRIQTVPKRFELVNLRSMDLHLHSHATMATLDTHEIFLRM